MNEKNAKKPQRMRKNTVKKTKNRKCLLEQIGAAINKDLSLKGISERSVIHDFEKYKKKKKMMKG
ncbi:MAG: hypothetical protein AB1546_02190 [bacterium]